MTYFIRRRQHKDRDDNIFKYIFFNITFILILVNGKYENVFYFGNAINSRVKLAKSVQKIVTKNQLYRWKAKIL